MSSIPLTTFKCPTPVGIRDKEEISVENWTYKGNDDKAIRVSFCKTNDDKSFFGSVVLEFSNVKILRDVLNERLGESESQQARLENQEVAILAYQKNIKALEERLAKLEQLDDTQTIKIDNASEEAW